MRPGKTSSVEEHEVRVVPHDPAWAAQFDVEAEAIRRVLGHSIAEVEHFGATAVPELLAKPIIDILAGARRASGPSETHIAGLEKLGYEYLGEDGRRPGRFFFRKRHGTWCNLSIVPYKSLLWCEGQFFIEQIDAARRIFSES